MAIYMSGDVACFQPTATAKQVRVRYGCHSHHSMGCHARTCAVRVPVVTAEAMPIAQLPVLINKRAETQSVRKAILIELDVFGTIPGGGQNHYNQTKFFDELH